MRPKAAQSRYLLGVDVALRNTGVVVYDSIRKRVIDARVFSTERDAESYVIDSNVSNVRQQARSLDALIAFYKPSHVFAELPHGGAKSSRAASMMALAIGGLVALLYARKITLVSVTPMEVKNLVRPSGKVDKTEVAAVVIESFGADFASSIMPASRREHAYDAAGALLAAIPRTLIQ